LATIYYTATLVFFGYTSKLKWLARNPPQPKCIYILMCDQHVYMHA